MLLADDVIYLTAKEHVILMDETVLAKTLGTFRDEPSKLGTDIAGAHRNLLLGKVLLSARLGETHQMLELKIVFQL